MPQKFVGDAPFALTAPTTNSDGAFTYSSSNLDVATVSGTTVTLVGAGSTTITATQAATASYGSNSIAATLNVTFPLEAILGISKSVNAATDYLVRIEFSVASGRDPTNNTTVSFTTSAGGGFFAPISVTKKTGTENVYYAIIQFRSLEAGTTWANVGILNTAGTIIYSPTTFYIFGPAFT